MTDEMARSESGGADGRNLTRRAGPGHPMLKASLLMLGIVIFLVVVSVLSVVGGR